MYCVQSCASRQKDIQLLNIYQDIDIYREIINKRLILQEERYKQLLYTLCKRKNYAAVYKFSVG